MKKLLLVSLVLGQAGLAGAAPVVVELFTSQGCSSCPDADRLLSAWGREQFEKGAILPLSYNVDYWNYLGWKDVFSKPAWSRRQQDYAQALGVGVYTPQIVVAGRQAMVGSDADRVEAAVAAHKGDAPEAELTLTAGKAPGTFRIEARAAKPLSAPRRLMLALFENGLSTDVGAGENSGRSLRNDFVVRRLVDAGELPAGAGDFAKAAAAAWDPAWNKKNSGAAVFLQDPATLAVTAVAVLYPLAR